MAAAGGSLVRPAPASGGAGGGGRAERAAAEWTGAESASFPLVSAGGGGRRRGVSEDGRGRQWLLRTAGDDDRVIWLTR